MSALGILLIVIFSLSCFKSALAYAVYWFFDLTQVTDNFLKRVCRSTMKRLKFSDKTTENAVTTVQCMFAWVRFIFIGAVIIYLMNTMGGY